MTEFLETCFSGPALPASILLLAVIGYWLLVVVGVIGLEMLDFDFDVDVDLDADGMLNSVMSAGAVTFKFLNIGQLPINLWLSVFAISVWVISLVWTTPETSFWMTTLIVLRNFAVALVPTKILTQPLRGRFEPIEPVEKEDLVGVVGEVSTADVSQTSGQGRFKGDAAPLLLNVRTIQGVLPKGEQIRIVEYDAEQDIFKVEKAVTKDV